MTYLRSLLFTVGFYGLTTVLCFAYLPLLILPSKAFAKCAKFWVRLSICMVQGLLGIRYELRGRENLPDGPAIYASKHQSAWETLALNLILDMPAFVLKKELMRIPIFGWYLARADNISVDRSAGAKALKDMVDQAKAVLEDRRDIVIFPQGTRTSVGERDAAYLPGVAGLYAKAGVPVVPVALNSGVYWPRRRFLKRPGTIVVEFLPPIPPGQNRKTFMRDLAAGIENATETLEKEGLARIAA